MGISLLELHEQKLILDTLDKIILQSEAHQQAINHGQAIEPRLAVDDPKVSDYKRETEQYKQEIAQMKNEIDKRPS
jgi:hypothetical protein